MKSLYYISSGEKNGFYTLRHQYTIVIQAEDGQAIYDYDNFVRTLSTDSKKAVIKAAMLGYKVSEPEFSLDEIKRRKSKMVAEERARYEALAEQAKIKEADLLKKFLESGCWPMGKYSNQPFEVAPASYIMYFAQDEHLGPYLKAAFPELFPTVNDKSFGEAGSKYVEKVTCIESFGFEGNYGYTRVIKMVTSAGNLLTYMGSGSFRAEKGAQLNIAFKVKAHESYEGEKTTKIFYVKEVA